MTIQPMTGISAKNFTTREKKGLFFFFTRLKPELESGPRHCAFSCESLSLDWSMNSMSSRSSSEGLNT